MSSDASRQQAAIPDWYDDLDGSLAEGWGLLVRGAVDRRSPMRTVAIATVNADGLPSVRTVVLRAVDPRAWRIRFHTDARSRKVDELLRQPTVAALAYHAPAKIQLRLTGQARVLSGDDASPIWAGVTPHGRECYRVARAPGEPIASPAEGAAMIADGRERFRAIEVDVATIEWLYLASAGHRRARYRRDASGQVAGEWLVP
jgi:pyridoxine/pyridoxamine 5'-phosphate oxidase